MTPPTHRVFTWDIWIRLFHWAFAFSVGFQIFSGKTGTGFFEWHRVIGEIVFMLVLFRILWGSFGSENARLLALIRSPKAAIEHVIDAVRAKAHPERGHNAAGGWAVLALLGLAGALATTGMFIADEDYLIEGARASMLNDSTIETLRELHETLATAMLLLIALHIGMVIYYLVRVKLNLIPAMVTGRQSWPESLPVPETRFANPMLGLVLAMIAGAVTAWIARWPLF